MASSHLTSISGTAGVIDIRCLEEGDTDIAADAELRLTGFKDKGKVLVRNPDIGRYDDITDTDLKERFVLEVSSSLNTRLKDLLKNILANPITQDEFMARLRGAPKDTTAEVILESRLTIDEFMRRAEKAEHIRIDVQREINSRNPDFKPVPSLFDLMVAVKAKEE